MHQLSPRGKRPQQGRERSPGQGSRAADTRCVHLHGSPRERGRPRLALGVQVEEPSTGKAAGPVAQSPQALATLATSLSTGRTSGCLAVASEPYKWAGPVHTVSSHTHVEYAQNGPSHPVC